MQPILQSHLPFAPWADPLARKLPGIRPVDLSEWILPDDAYAAQMALRDSLVAERPEAVLQLDPAARPAATELLALLTATLAESPGHRLCADHLCRPDGVEVPLDGSDPMRAIARLCQDDFCILENRGAEHVLTGAALCFPASWSLGQKFLRPLIRIHQPVPSYDGGIATRVQRLFDAIRPGQVLCRANSLLYVDPSLHQPRQEGESRPRPGLAADFVRSERQCLRRLPETGAVIFSIHTYVVHRDNLTKAQEVSLQEHLRAGAPHN